MSNNTLRHFKCWTDGSTDWFDRVQGVGLRILQPVSDTFESGFELLNGVAINDISLETVTIKIDLIRKKLPAMISVHR